MIDACTIIAGHRLGAARVLADSFFAHHPDGSFTVLVVDDERREIAPDGGIDRRITWWRLADLGLDPADIHRLASIYDAAELCTAVKPLLLDVLLRARRSPVIHLDPDIRVFGPLEDVSRLAEEHGIVLTPHVIDPVRDDGGVDARFALVSGVYNLGFVAAAPQAEPCLTWWWQRTRRRALNGDRQQTFTDERWTDAIPSLFGHHLLKDPGCNVGYWNLHERPLTRAGGRVHARNVPLRFFNFSGFDDDAPGPDRRGSGPRILRGGQPVAATLHEEYAAALDRAGAAASSQRGYGWEVSADGLAMTPRIRRLYWAALLAAERGETPEPPDPFDAAHPEAFTAWVQARLEPPAPLDAVAPIAATSSPHASAGNTTRWTSLTWRDVKVSLVIGFCCLLVYNANGRSISTGDTYPARYQPFALWQYRTLFLDPVEALTTQGRERTTRWDSPSPGAAYWLVPARDGHLASLYPVVVPVLVTPLYLPAFTYLSARGWTDQRIDTAARIMEKVAASVVTALSVSLVYLALRRRTKTSIAVLLAVAYALGTSTWVISSQALWQHGIAQLLIAGAILILTGPYTAARAVTLGLLLGLIVGNRPPDAVLVAALGLYALFWAGRRSVIVIAASAVPLLLVLFYNLTAIGTVAGAYGLTGHAKYFLRHDPITGLAGLLVSPSRGLFVFSPFLLFLVLAWRYRPPDRAGRLLTILMAAALIVQLVLYSLTDWRGGMSWGPRFLTDMLPMLIWLLAPVVAALGRPGRACFAAAVCIGIAIEAIGAFTYTGVTDTAIFADGHGGPASPSAAWDWRNAPFIAPLEDGLAPLELLQPMRGSLDLIEAGGRPTDTVAAGQDVIVKGWALAGRATPAQVGIAIDGGEATAVRSFFDRPDVRAAFPGTEPAGWRIPLTTAGLTPGQHRLSLYAWGSHKGESYFLARRTLSVRPTETDLGASAVTAAARIREHQQGAGSWLTAFTIAPRFEQPRDEMNTFLTSLLVDLIDPLPATAGLADNVQRARRHLTGQIEENGLVRYHGLPDGPGIGTLGCAITPDTDDTALVWRIAPPQDRRRLPAALATLHEYQRSDGLYRTWLAPRDGYQCLDPGRDPNPADVTIQMHLLQLLLSAQPAEGRALCDALGPRLDDPSIWVYYDKTSLVPMLRTRDLERTGCRLTLPASRTQTSIRDQQIWIDTVQLLLRATRTDGPPPAAAEITDVLQALAGDDFALLRRNPPLLYHNDLTATVPRYYWSPDVGYALWLRLAQATGQIPGVR